MSCTVEPASYCAWSGLLATVPLPTVATLSVYWTGGWMLKLSNIRYCVLRKVPLENTPFRSVSGALVVVAASSSKTSDVPTQTSIRLLPTDCDPATPGTV